MKEGSKNEDYWKKKLTKEQFRVLRKKGTEHPFTGEYWDNHETGIYLCAGCGEPLFDATDKFNSGTGWPSFSKAMESKVKEKKDLSHGMVRTEVLCKKCNGHLGHVFKDGPGPDKNRYCINSISLDFKKED